MCGTVALGLLGGLLASKLLFRRRFRHHHFDGGGGGGRHFGRWGRRRWQQQEPVPPPAVTPAGTPERLHKLLPILELNERQKEEAREAFGDVQQALGPGWQNWSGLDEALAAVAAEPFDAARAKAAVGGVGQAKVAVDALEHIHNILTPEQRDKLDEALLGRRQWR
jgi:Spy/CpxP family protein refolding chaperone